MRKIPVSILMLVISAAAVAQGSSHPKCEASINGAKIQKVYIIGDQYEAVLWAYKHLAEETCLTPTTDPGKADAILELQPLPPSGSPAYDTSANVTCTTSNGSTQCIDSTGNELSVDCSKGGCESTYGPNPYTAMASSTDAFLSTSWYEADATLYTVDYKPLWNSQDQKGDWPGAGWVDKVRLGTNSPVCKVGTWSRAKYKNFRYWASTTCGVEFDPLVSIDIKLREKRAAAKAAQASKPQR